MTVGDPGDAKLEDAARGLLTAKSHAQMEEYRSAREVKVLTILFCDLVGSTRQQSALGNLRAAELTRSFRETFRAALAGVDGREVETAGDSILAVFAAPSDGVRFALLLLAALRAERARRPDLPELRVGLHQGQVVVETHDGGPKAMDVYGLQVSTAARITDLAGGGQILCSRAVFDDARAILNDADLTGLSAVAWRNHGPYRFKGVEEPYDVCEVGEEGRAPFLAPPATAKGWPAQGAEEELGWRPAAGVTVPGTSWVLEERLGREAPGRAAPTFRGEFGEVWRAANTADRSRQVFKFCFKREKVPALKREARLLKRLRRCRHPNLVEVYDVTEGDRPPYYLEMEYVEGPSLAEWIAGDPPLPERLEVLAQVADALDTVHAAGIFHRDIKPSNILLGRREDLALIAKLTDFGLGAAADRDLLKSVVLDAAEGVAGTWDYIAPELRRGGEPSARSDLYSLGVTIFQVVAGDLARGLGGWESEVASDVLREDLRMCLATDPAQRFARGADLAKALRTHDQRVAERRAVAERERHRARARRFRLLAAAAGAVALVVLVLGGLAIRAAREARRQEREAARQRDRATSQKELALAAIRKLTFDVPDRLRGYPGTLPALRDILAENVDMLDRILALEADQGLALEERTANHLRLSGLWVLLGDAEKAVGAAEAARRLCDVPGAPGGAAADLLRADCAIHLGDAKDLAGRADEALAAYEQAAELAGGAGPLRARILGRRGRVLLGAGRAEEALAAYVAQRDAAKALAAAAPDRVDLGIDLVSAWSGVADASAALGKTSEALDAYRAGTAAAEDLAARFPADRRPKGCLVTLGQGMGELMLALNWPVDARKVLEGALAEARLLAAADPGGVFPRWALSGVLGALGEAHLLEGNGSGAWDAFREDAEISASIAAADPGSAPARWHLLGRRLNVARAVDGCRDEESFAYAFQEFEDLLARETEPAEASAAGRRAIAGAMDGMAWLLLTGRLSTPAGRERALPLAEGAAELTGRKDPMPLASLALAQLRAGRAAEALATQDEIVTLVDEGRGHAALSARLKVLLSAQR